MLERAHNGDGEREDVSPEFPPGSIEAFAFSRNAEVAFAYYLYFTLWQWRYLNNGNKMVAAAQIVLGRLLLVMQDLRDEDIGAVLDMLGEVKPPR